jgi:hypothetical protein
MRCPRQYYYSRVLKLGPGDVEAASAIYTAIGEAVKWLRSEWHEGRSPDAESAAARFDEEWERLVERDLPTYTRSRALAMVETVRKAWQDEGLRLAPEGLRLWAHLENAHVAVTADLLGYDKDGSLVIGRNRYGRPQDDDHTHIRLALYRRAAADTSPETPARVELRYLTHGTKRVVPPSARWEPDRLRKYNQAAVRIANREFPAAPKEEELCAGCPYYYTCPS